MRFQFNYTQRHGGSWAKGVQFSTANKQKLD